MRNPETYEDPSEEEILARLKRAMKQALRGEGRSAHEFLDELEREENEESEKSDSEE